MRNKIGSILKEARIKQNLTQLELSRLLGYESMQFVSLFERGLSKLPPSKLKLICKHLKLNPKTIRRLMVQELLSDLDKEIKRGSLN